MAVYILFLWYQQLTNQVALVFIIMILTLLMAFVIHILKKKYTTMRSDTAANPLYTTVASGTFVTALMAMNHGDACPPPPTGMSCPDAGAFFNK